MAALSDIEILGETHDLACRRSTASPAARVSTNGGDFGPESGSLRDVVALLESMGGVTLQRDDQRAAVFVNESLPAASDSVAGAPLLFDVASVRALERAALAVGMDTTM